MCGEADAGITRGTLTRRCEFVGWLGVADKSSATVDNGRAALFAARKAGIGQQLGRERPLSPPGYTSRRRPEGVAHVPSARVFSVQHGARDVVGEALRNPARSAPLCCAGKWSELWRKPCLVVAFQESVMLLINPGTRVSFRQRQSCERPDSERDHCPRQVVRTPPISALIEPRSALRVARLESAPS